MMGRVAIYQSDVLEEEDIDEGSDHKHSEGSTRRKRPRLGNRLVNSLDASLDPRNYDDLVLPEENLEYTAVLQKKSKDSPEELITWQNFKGARRGRQGCENVIHIPGGVVGSAR